MGKSFDQLLSDFKKVDHQGKDELMKVINEYKESHVRLKAAFDVLREKKDVKGYVQLLAATDKVLANMQGDLKALRILIKQERKDIAGMGKIPQNRQNA